MAQKIDTSQFTDQFTNGSVRYAQTGIDRIAQNAWKFSISQRRGIFTIRTHLNGPPANFDTPFTVPLIGGSTLLRITKSPATAFSSTAATAWVNVSTGVYTVDLSSLTWLVGTYTAEIVATATFTNPIVSGLTSVLNDLPASYPAETLTSTWVPASAAVSVNSDGQFGDVEPVFDAVAFGLEGVISFR